MARTFPKPSCLKFIGVKSLEVTYLLTTVVPRARHQLVGINRREIVTQMIPTKYKGMVYKLTLALPKSVHDSDRSKRQRKVRT